MMNENEQTKTKYTDDELKEFKTLIEEKLTQARKELNDVQDALLEMNEDGQLFKTADWEEASQTTEREQLGDIAARLQKFIRGLEAALIRIQNKTYGICVVTGTLIDKRRLLAVPHTTMSVEAKKGNVK
jgi:DnaK suppressor protein